MRNLPFVAVAGLLIAAALPTSAAFVPGTTGEKSLYKLSYTGNGNASVRDMLSSKYTGTNQIQTQLTALMEIVQIDPSLFSVRLLSPGHQMQIDGQVQNLKSAISTLQQPCYLTVDGLGRVQSVSFSSSTPNVARSLMRSLISGFEFVRAGSTLHAWQAAQDTANGAAIADYSTTDGATFAKRITSYPQHRQYGPKGMPQIHPTTKGNLRFVFRKGQLQEVNGALSTRFTLAERTLSDGEERFQLNRISTSMASVGELRLLHTGFRSQCAVQRPTTLHSHDTDSASQRASWAALLKGATPGSLASELAAADAKGASNDSSVYTKLCALMTLQPQTCVGFEQMLSGAQPNKLSTRLVVAALAGVAGGSQERSQASTQSMQAAEQALYEVLEHHKQEADMVILAAPALGMAGAPHLASMSLLESLVDSPDRDIASSCALALGSMAHNGSPEMSRRAVEFLEHKLAVSNALIQQQLLAALGNAGSATSLNAISSFSNHSSPQLRGLAMMSLRLIPGAGAAEQLYRGLHDLDPDVRLNAARAFEFRPFSPADVQAFLRLISSEKVERVRQTLLENLNLELPYYPQAQAILVQASQHDESAAIRKTVSGWL